MSLYNRIKLMTTRYGAMMTLYMLTSAAQVFPMMSIGSVITQELKFSVTQVMFYYASIFIPWNFRAFYGLISDVYAIYGYRRRPYIILCNIIVGLGYLLYGNLVFSLNHAVLVGVILNVFFAFSQSAIDALSVDKIRELHPNVSLEERSELSCDIQSGNMVFRTLGSLISGLIASQVSPLVSPRTLISLSSVFPFLMAIISISAPIEARKPPGFVNSQFVWPKQVVQSLRSPLLSAVFILLYAVCLSGNMVYSAQLHATSGFTSYQFQVLLHLLSLGSLIGTCIFWIVFRKTCNLQRVLFYCVSMGALATISRLLVTLAGWNSFAFVASDEALISIVSGITSMFIPFYACLAASQSEQYLYEGFVFGIFTSLNNWGGTISGMLSSTISPYISLSAFVGISFAVSFLPLVLIPFISQRHVVKNGSKREELEQCSLNISL